MKRQKGETSMEKEQSWTSAVVGPTNAVDLIPDLETHKNHSYWSLGAHETSFSPFDSAHLKIVYFAHTKNKSL